jgi:hypothetical protein
MFSKNARISIQTFEKIFTIWNYLIPIKKTHDTRALFDIQFWSRFLNYHTSDYLFKTHIFRLSWNNLIKRLYKTLKIS